MGMDILRVGGFPAGPEGMPHSKHWSGWMEKQGNRIENPLAGYLDSWVGRRGSLRGGRIPGGLARLGKINKFNAFIANARCSAPVLGLRFDSLRKLN